MKMARPVWPIDQKKGGRHWAGRVHDPGAPQARTVRPHAPWKPSRAGEQPSGPAPEQGKHEQVAGGVRVALGE